MGFRAFLAPMLWALVASGAWEARAEPAAGDVETAAEALETAAEQADAESDGPAAEEAASEDAEATPLPTAPVLVERTGPWRPPHRDPERKDWLKLVSGEWVRGNIELVNEELLYFDSEELGDLEIDWVDVAEMRSAHRNTYRFTQGEDDDVIVTGTAAMRDGVMRVDTGSEIREFTSPQLLHMIEGDLRELNYWSLNVGLGLTVRSGNSDQTDASVNAQLERETPLTRALLSYQSAYSVVEEDEVTNNHRLYGEFAYYVSRRTYLQLPIAEAYRDRLQNIDLRTTVGAGVGYDVVDRARIDWDVTLGAGYQRTDFEQIEPGGDDPAHDAAVLFGTHLELDPWSDVDWDTDYRLQAVVTDFDKTSHHLTSVFSFEVWGPLDFDVTFVWDRIEGPEPDEDGEVPESDDFRLTAGLAIDL